MHESGEEWRDGLTGVKRARVPLDSRSGSSFAALMVEPDVLVVLALRRAFVSMGTSTCSQRGKGLCGSEA